jgi:uncharacterized repeat protein (TIGR02059 family)
VIINFAGQPKGNTKPVPAPVVTGATANATGTVITLTFTKAMNNPAGKQGDFAYQINGGSVQFFSAAVLNTDPTKIDLITAGIPIAYGDRVTVSYTGTDITSTDGGVLDNFGSRSDDKAIPVPAPAVIGATTNAAGTVITLTFTKVMNNPAGKHGAFAYQINGGSAQFFSAAALNADPKKIDLITVGMSIVYGDMVTVSYIGSDINATDGGVLEIFGEQSVDNNVPRRVPTPELTTLSAEPIKIIHGSLQKGQYQQILNGIIILFLIVNVMIIFSLVSERSQNSSVNPVNITAIPSPTGSPTSTIITPVKTILPTPTIPPTPKPTPTPVPPEKGYMNILYVYNKNFDALWAPTYVNLVNPPLIIDFDITPMNMTDLIPYDYKVMSTTHHDTINFTRPSDDAWFTVAVKYRNGGGLVDEDGYGGIYSQQTPKRLVIRTPGNYTIQANGNYVNATLSVQIPKEGNMLA